MKREFKFRAYNHIAKKMYFESKIGDVFKWHNEGQLQTIMQFTGLTDKNGVEIYEEDIVKDGTRLLLVRFTNGSFNFFTKSNYMVTPVDTTWFEVIGNIYENPELIKLQ